MGLFGKRVTPEEKLKQFKQSLRRSCREIERERSRLQAQETKMKSEMKKLAAKGETESVMIIAKDLVRNRQAMKKFLKLGSQMESLGLRIETIKAQAGVNKALKGAAQAMHQLNRMVNVPQMQMIMQKFMMENEMMDMKGEMVDEAMDDIWEDDETDLEEETAAQYAQIFGEIGIPCPPNIAEQVKGEATALT
ncbi:vacuolar protein sorting-associated protein 2 1 [Histomonas meleagridis]|uniref:vacuolar protein sorting-associated protein 2-like 1 n=1 Tax=Histomonas meleagridis TaxID=135588 RepID=UPI0035593908|nr:vacuolar protein sorting-associated protein 2 1 [Histomonas meleagridis]KAH0797717.1 vacuolar protein sorting-associated protein 2-like 1 [Histomonas meleagridis]